MGHEQSGIYWLSELLAATEPSGALRRLEGEVESLTSERLDLGRFAGPRHRDEPGLRWVPYKEAFSPALVRELLDRWGSINGTVLDPFAGSGTTLQVAVERDLPAVGIELLAYPRWAAATIMAARSADSDDLRALVTEAGLAPVSNRTPAPELPAPAAKWALSADVNRTLIAIRDALPKRSSSIEADLAHLALITVVESVSNSVKDGTSLRHRERIREGRTTRPGRRGLTVSSEDVVTAFRRSAGVIIDDIPKLPSADSPAHVIGGDARHLPLQDGSVGAAVFSPPYPNRYDYTAIYQLELAFGGFVRTTHDLYAARKSLLRSHLEAPPPNDPVLDDAVVNEVLHGVASSARQARDPGRTLRMLVGYFDDMRNVLRELERVLEPNAPAACVVATQTYFGTALPTDLMLASLARGAGLRVEGLWVLRRKRVAVQQRVRGSTSTGGRECALLLRKPG